MSINGELRRLSHSRLLDILPDADAIEAEVLPWGSHASNDGACCTVEKTWNAIEFTLDRLAESKHIPWVGPITEGEETPCVLHYGPVWYRDPNGTQEIATILNDVTRDLFDRGFNPRLMEDHRVYPDIWQRERSELLDYVWRYFEDLKVLYNQAASNQQAILTYLC